MHLEQVAEVDLSLEALVGHHVQEEQAHLSLVEEVDPRGLGEEADHHEQEEVVGLHEQEGLAHLSLVEGADLHAQEEAEDLLMVVLARLLMAVVEGP